jgi:hypothetical protein
MSLKKSKIIFLLLFAQCQKSVNAQKILSKIYQKIKLQD